MELTEFLLGALMLLGIGVIMFAALHKKESDKNKKLRRQIDDLLQKGPLLASACDKVKHYANIAKRQGSTRIYDYRDLSLLSWLLYFHWTGSKTTAEFEQHLVDLFLVEKEKPVSVEQQMIEEELKEETSNES